MRNYGLGSPAHGLYRAAVKKDRRPLSHSIRKATAVLLMKAGLRLAQAAAKLLPETV